MPDSSNFLSLLIEGIDQLRDNSHRASLSLHGQEISLEEFTKLLTLFINSNPNLLPNGTLLLKSHGNLLDHLSILSHELKEIKDDDIILGDDLQKAIEHGNLLKKENESHFDSKEEGLKRFKRQVELGELAKSKKEISEQLIAKEQVLANSLAQTVDTAKAELQTSLFKEIQQHLQQTSAIQGKSSDEITATAFLLARDTANKTTYQLHSLNQNDFAKDASELLHQNLSLVLDQNGIRFEETVFTKMVPAIVQSVPSLKLASIAQNNLRIILSESKLSAVIDSQKVFYEGVLVNEISEALGKAQATQQQAQKEIQDVSTDVVNSIYEGNMLATFSRKPEVENAVTKFKEEHKESLRHIADLTRMYNRYKDFAKNEDFVFDEKVLRHVELTMLTTDKLPVPQTLTGISANAALYTLLTVDDKTFSSLKETYLTSLKEAAALPQEQKLEKSLTAIHKLYLLQQAEAFRKTSPENIEEIKRKVFQLPDLKGKPKDSLIDVIKNKVDLAITGVIPQPVKDIFVAVSERSTIVENVTNALETTQKTPPESSQQALLPFVDSLLKESIISESPPLYALSHSEFTILQEDNDITIKPKRDVFIGNVKESIGNQANKEKARVGDLVGKVKSIPTKPATKLASPIATGFKNAFTSIAIFLGRNPITFGGGLVGAGIGTIVGGFPQGTFAGGLTGLVSGSIVRGGLFKGIAKEIRGFGRGLMQAQGPSLEGLLLRGSPAAVFPEFALIVGSIAFVVFIIFVAVIGKGGLDVNPTGNNTTNIGGSCPTQLAIDQNRQSPASCQYLHPSINILDTSFSQSSIDAYVTKYGKIFVSGGGGDLTEFQRRVSYIVTQSQQTGLNPVLLLGYWDTESRFSTYPGASDLGCAPGSANAKGFENQVSCSLNSLPARCAVSKDAHSDACKQIDGIRKAHPDLYTNYPITLPIATFDDFAEVYGPANPNLNGTGTTNNNCVHTYNTLLEVALAVNSCSGTGNNVASNGTLQSVLDWDAKINAALNQGLWSYFNVMLADITNGSYSAQKRQGQVENTADAGLYWCTNSIIDSYTLAGLKGLGPDQQAVVSMENFWKTNNGNATGYKYIAYLNSDHQQTLQSVSPGFAIFFEKNPGNFTGKEHVAMVQSISIDANGNGSIRTMDSNSSAKGHTYPVAAWEVKNIPYTLTGFGGI